jgi:hypothetical protein
MLNAKFRDLHPGFFVELAREGTSKTRVRVLGGGKSIL